MVLPKQPGHTTNAENSQVFRREGYRAKPTRRKCAVTLPKIGSLIAAHASRASLPADGVKTDGSKTMSDQVTRLQAAVRQMLYELNLYQQQANHLRVNKEPLDTIETYGLTQGDME